MKQLLKYVCILYLFNQCLIRPRPLIIVGAETAELTDVDKLNAKIRR